MEVGDADNAMFNRSRNMEGIQDSVGLHCYNNTSLDLLEFSDNTSKLMQSKLLKNRR